jgi:hypothetical protein
MQGIQAIDDLLERSAGDEPREDGVGVEDRRLLARQSGTGRAKAADQSFVRQDVTGVSAFGERAAQLIGVPPGFAEDDDLHTVADRYENSD